MGVERDLDNSDGGRECGSGIAGTCTGECKGLVVDVESDTSG